MYLNQTTFIVFIIFMISVVLFLLTSLIFIIKIYKASDKTQDAAFMLLVKYERMESLLNDMKESSTSIPVELCDAIDYIADTVESLSSSNKKVLQNFGKPLPGKIYPQPQLAHAITDTIREQISIELAKSKKLRIPKADYLSKVARNVCRTYPEIDINYIANKCIAVFESMGV